MQTADITHCELCSTFPRYSAWGKREATRKRFNLATYTERKGEVQGEKLASGFEAMDFARYLHFMTTELPPTERLSEPEAIAAWNRDQKLLEVESFEVRNPKTGVWEQRDHLWVPTKSRTKEKFQQLFQEKVSDKSFRLENPDNNALVSCIIIFAFGSGGLELLYRALMLHVKYFYIIDIDQSTWIWDCHGQESSYAEDGCWWRVLQNEHLWGSVEGRGPPLIAFFFPGG